MPRVVPSVVEPALRASTDPLAAELLGRLREAPAARAKATKPFPRWEALRIYQRKAALGNRPAVRTDGFPALLAALATGPEEQVIVHGVAFADAVYLVFTDAGRMRCVGLLRKVRVAPG